MLYFNYLMGNDLPYTTTAIKFNFFNTANVKWGINVRSGVSEADQMTFYVKAVPAMLQSDFNERAYSQFDGKIDIGKLQPEIEEEGTYIVDHKTGRIVKAIVIKNEIADKDVLFTKMAYTLLCDAVYKQRPKEKTLPAKTPTEIEDITGETKRRPMSLKEYTLWQYEQQKAEDLLKKK